MATLELAITTQNESIDKVIASLNKLSAAISRVKAPINDATKAVTKHTSAFKKLDSSVKRIAFYRTIRFAMKQVAQAFIQGVKNVALYSQALNNLDSTHANATMSAFATNLLYIKNSIGAAVMPLLQALVPLANAVADAFANAANAVNQFFHALKGEVGFTKAKKYAVDFADGLGAASGKAKELKKQLFGFDELNVFTEPSSGGSGGGSAMDYSRMFEEAEVTDFFKEIRDLAMSAEWEKLGGTIADKVNEIVAKVDEVKIGTKLGQKVQAFVGTAFGYTKGIDAKKIGEKLSGVINNFVKQIKWEEVGGTIAAGFTNALDFFAGLIEKADTKDWAEAIGSTVTGILDHFQEWIDNVKWEEVGATFFQKVYDFVTGINFTEIAQKFFTALGTFLLGAFKTLEGFLSSVFDKWDEYCGVEADDTGIETAGKWLLGIWNGLVGIATWVYDNVVTPFFNALRGKLGIDKENGEMETMGEDAIGDFLHGLTLKWEDVAKWVKEKVQWFKDQFNGLKDWWSNKNGTFTWTPSMDIKGSVIKGKAFAEGGQPQAGSIFLAGENGSELLTQIGGHSTVTTQDQFTEGMSNIMDNTNTVILQAAQALISAIQNKDMTAVVSIGDRQIVSAYDRGKRLAGASLVE